MLIVQRSPLRIRAAAVAGLMERLAAQ